jgi:hypothetical protein
MSISLRLSRENRQNNSIHGQRVLVYPRLSSPNGDPSTVDHVGRAGDARNQVRLPNPNYHPNEKQQFFGVGLAIVVAAS